MSTLATLTQLATGAVATTLHAVSHPVETATTVAYRARVLAAAAIGAPERQVDPTAAPATPIPEPEVRTPAGIPAAAPGHNPDTTESDLHQPDTEPLMDPSLTKKVKAESDTLRKAAELPGE